MAYEEIGLTRSRIFFEADLWEKCNRVRVMECLFELARIASSKGVHPWDESSLKSSEKRKLKLDESEVNKVRDQLSKLRTIPAPGTLRKEAPGLIKRKLQFLIGQSNFPEVELKIQRIQALVRAKIAKREYLERVRKHTFRQKVVKELYDTETSYVNNLKLCITKFLEPLRTGSWSKKLRPNSQKLKHLFSDIELIYNFNKTLHSDIEQRLSVWSPSQKISDIFLSIMGFLKVYSNYVSTYDQSLRVYEEIKSEEKLFTQFIFETSSKMNVLDLQSLLIMPIQRIPRYYMLLESFLKYTWEDHQDYEDLHKVVSGLKEVATYLNEKKREFEKLQSLFEIQSKISGCPHIALLNRDFIGEYELYDVKKKTDVILYLLSDLLVVSKLEKKDMIRFKESFPMDDIEILKRDSDVLDIMVKDINALSLKSKNEEFMEAFQLARSVYQSKMQLDGDNDESSEDISPEEVLRLRELEKRRLKKLVENDQKGDRPKLRTTQSLLKMKAIIEHQLVVVTESNKSEYRQNLDHELKELDLEISRVKSTLSKQDLMTIKEQEEEIAQDVKLEGMALKKKKKRFRLFRSKKKSKSKDKESDNLSKSKDKDTNSPSKKERRSSLNLSPSKENSPLSGKKEDRRKRAATVSVKK